MKRGANSGSGHHLFIARTQMKPKSMNPREGRIKFSIQQFQVIGTVELYQITLHNWFHPEDHMEGKKSGREEK